MHTESRRQELLARATTLRLFPVPSVVIKKVFEVLSDANCSFSHLFDVIRYDQSISAKIISLANSSYYSRGTEISDLERAVNTIGFEEVKKTLTALLLLSEIPKESRLGEEDLRVLWKHSLAVAYSAKILASKALLEDPEKTFTAALLHDIGKIVFYTHGAEYGTTVEEANRTGRDLSIMERERYGIDHQEIGYCVARKWKFPEAFCTVIGHHHNGKVAGGGDVLVRLIWTADEFYGAGALSSPEGMILARERGRIATEVERIAEIMGLSNAKGKTGESR
jgi:putative nucleotidyltransferase with HDIG domain